MSEMSERTSAELVDLVHQLLVRVEGLESALEALKATQPVPEEDLLAIAGAAAAYMGYKGKVKAVSFARRTGWSEASRRGRTTNLSRGTTPQAY